MTDKELNAEEIEILKSFESCPTTEEILKELKQLEPVNWDKDPEFVAGELYGQITEDILIAMEAEGINKTQLAERLGKSRQYVSRILKESAKMTLKKLANIAIALNKKVEIRIIE